MKRNDLMRWLICLDNNQPYFSFKYLEINFWFPYIVSWEPEGRYHYSMMFYWEPEGHYPCYKIFSNSALLVLNGTSLMSVNDLLLHSQRYKLFLRRRQIRWDIPYLLLYDNSSVICLAISIHIIISLGFKSEMPW